MSVTIKYSIHLTAVCSLSVLCIIKQLKLLWKYQSIIILSHGYHRTIQPRKHLFSIRVQFWGISDKKISMRKKNGGGVCCLLV